MATSTAKTSSPHVLIIGAGISGLTLAQSLRKQNITFEIFDRDASPAARFQGWAIALGIEAIEGMRRAFPDDVPAVETASHLPPGIDAEFALYKGDGTEFFRVSGNMLRANRQKLRELLWTNVEIQWNKTCKFIEQDEKLTVHFTDGTTAVGDLVVGADGGHSKVRDYLFPNQKLLRQTPTCTISGEVTLSAEDAAIQETLARSSYLVFAEQTRYIVGLKMKSSNLDQSIDYYWSFIHNDATAENNPDYWTRHASQEELYAYVLKHTEHLNPKLNRIIKLTGSSGIVKPGFSLYDILLPEIPGQNVTLIGDAAHVMVPARGQGGNHAVLDALKLAEAIKKDDIKAYEAEMLERGHRAVKDSWAAVSDHGDGTAAGLKMLQGGN